MVTTVHHESAPTEHKWCVVTYRNTPRYPAVRVDHFDSFRQAQDYVEKVEPSVPRISFGGRAPQPPPSYDRFAKWKSDNKLKEYDYRAMYLPGGSNARETIITKP